MVSPIEPINGKYKGKDIISLDQFSPKDISILFKKTVGMLLIAKNARPSDLLKGNIVTLIFYEPSSRTFGSFVAAVKQLGGSTVEILDPEHFSSVSKGESLEDTIRVFEAYCDVIVLRHPKKGATLKAAQAAGFVPVINAGDGIGEHPTQALLDLYTIYERTKKLDNLIGVLAGDMLNGRTIHSLIRGLSKFNGNKLYLLSPKELRLSREDLSSHMESGKLELVEIESEKDIPKNADFWYWTRVQKERFKSESAYEKVKNRFVLDNKLIKERAGKNTIFMHPLPRVGEILPEVDKNPNAVYLRSEIRNGMYIRMALLALILGKSK
ncbi:MAG: aspartate carbamoyltransferase [Candidatus Levybacteria bacterium]|nr:aspartate carbamoyltransferase [Candidatus Levybacteria bacterium]